MNLENKRFVAVAGCVLCPAFQAVESEINKGWSTHVLNCLTDKGYNIITLQCPEVTYNGYINGRKRKKHGIDFYSKDAYFVAHCEDIAEKETQRIYEMVRAGYILDYIIGIENSPTCAVSYMYTHLGMQHRKGIYYEFLEEKLVTLGIEVKWLGVNRTHLRKFIEEITKER